MLSNFRNQLKEFKMEDKFAEVFAEVPVVREALGWIPLVTPTSQIVGNQAFFNVKMGRWKQLSKETIDVALGYYGTTPAPVNPEVQAMASKQAGLSPITCRPVDSTAVKRKGMEDLRKELASKGYPTDDEHCVIWAMFPQQVEGYYKAKSEPAPAAAPVAPKAAAPVTSAAPVAFSGRSDMVLSVSGKKYNVTVEQA
jgi:oxaloacetate decarboxylase alpha subunit/pyruvate carboxylase subunit B